jgi:[ribosomal protein S18]-alanine N-acetyltransferase
LSDAADNVLLRPLGPLDLAVAAGLHARCFDSAWNDAAMVEILAMPGSFGALAQIGNQAVGLVIALAVGTEAEILTLAVLPQARRRGVARRLLAWVVGRLSEVNCQRLLLEVAEDNAAARTLYAKLGFAEIGRRPSYYRRLGGTTGAVVLARALGRQDT